MRVLLPLLVLAACALPPADEEAVWFATSYSWGQQCVPGSEADRPDVEGDVAALPLTVLERRVEGGAACRACYTCPAGAVVVYLLVPREEAPLAVELGLRRIWDADGLPSEGTRGG